MSVQVPVSGDRRGWVHFGVCAGVLLVTAVGWSWAVNVLKLAMYKEPVPWPAEVRVDPKDFRLLSLPAKFGPYEQVLADGELERQANGAPDGEIVFAADQMEMLKIGTPIDEARVAQRRSNWYVARIYRDTRRSPRDPMAYWRLEMFYYTGALDKVPHVPERCAVAGGAQMVGSTTIEFDVPAARRPWDRPIPFRRTVFEMIDRASQSKRQNAEYYTFSLNGQAESSWEQVRWTLSTSPQMKYCYFAKVQFGPLGEVSDLADTDEAARAFVGSFLPSVLYTLPMPEDVAALSDTPRNQSKERK